jgi:hypothetical protein
MDEKFEALDIDSIYRAKTPSEVDGQESLEHYLWLKNNGYLAVSTVCSTYFTVTYGRKADDIIEPHTEDATKSAVLGPLVYELEDDKYRVMTYGCAYYVQTQSVNV